MKKWSYLVLIVGWTLSMVYEALFVPELTGVYVLMAAVVDLVLLGLYAWELRKERRGTGSRCPSPRGSTWRCASCCACCWGWPSSRPPRTSPPT